MTEAFQYLCLVMDEESRTVAAYEASEWPENGFDRLLALGFFNHVENSLYVVCPDCLDQRLTVAPWPSASVRAPQLIVLSSLVPSWTVSESRFRIAGSLAQ